MRDAATEGVFDEQLASRCHGGASSSSSHSLLRLRHPSYSSSAIAGASTVSKVFDKTPSFQTHSNFNLCLFCK
jgi:hypothetical protein